MSATQNQRIAIAQLAQERPDLGQAMSGANPPMEVLPPPPPYPTEVNVYRYGIPALLFIGVIAFWQVLPYRDPTMLLFIIACIVAFSFVRKGNRIHRQYLYSLPRPQATNRTAVLLQTIELPFPRFIAETPVNFFFMIHIPIAINDLEGKTLTNFKYALSRHVEKTLYDYTDMETQRYTAMTVDEKNKVPLHRFVRTLDPEIVEAMLVREIAPTVFNFSVLIFRFSIRIEVPMPSDPKTVPPRQRGFVGTGR